MKNNDRFIQLIAELENTDSKAADAAGRAIIDIGNEGVPSLMDAFGTPSTNVKRRIAYLLGELGRGEASFSAQIQSALSTALYDDDWKVRRNSAIGLGKIGDDLAVQFVLDALKREIDPRVRTSLILAFGRVAEVRDLPSLKEIQLTSDEERKAAHKVLDRFSVVTGDIPTIQMDSALSTGVDAELWCRSGIADIVALEATGADLDAKVLGPDRIGIQNPPNLNHLLHIRSALFPVLVSYLQSDYASALKLGREFNVSTAAAEMVRLTNGIPVSYRLTAQPPLASHQRRRDWIDEFAKGCDNLVNRATGYSWEVVIKTVNKRVLLGARPATYTDERFAYRKLDVPASVHPTLAAAAVRLVEPRASDVIVDPFCGSGTLLAERAIHAPYEQLIGIDISSKAVNAARTNLSDFKRISLEQADFSKLKTFGTVDLIITNPPYGLRMSTPSAARRLHAQLDELAASVLRPGGNLIVFRPPAFPNPKGLRVVRRDQVDAGGVQVDILVARK